MAEKIKKNLISRSLSVFYLENIEAKLESRYRFKNSIPSHIAKCLKIPLESYIRFRSGEKILNRVQIDLLGKEFDLSIDSALRQKFIDNNLHITHPKVFTGFNMFFAKINGVQKVLSRLRDRFRSHPKDEVQKPQRSHCHTVEN